MSRIKMFVALPIKPGVTRQYFHDHWRHPHGSWGKRISTVQHYVQSHRIDSTQLAEDQGRYEGVCELWFDGIKDCIELGAHPVYRQYLVQDEPRFIDMKAIRFTFADEEILQSAPSPVEQVGNADFAWREDWQPVTVKLIQLIEADGPNHWAADSDLEAGRRIGALRHVRARPNSTLHPGGAAVSITPLANTAEDEGKLIGVRELWWPTVSAFEEGVSADPVAFRELIRRPKKATTMLFQSERMM